MIRARELLARHAAIIPLVFFALTGCREHTATIAPASTTELSATEQLLDTIRRCWNPRTKDRLIREAIGRVPGLGRGLAAVLANPAHPLLAEAVLVAGSFGDEALAAALLELWETGPRELWPALAHAIERLQPWSLSELAALLDEPDPELQLAVLRLCSEREDPPIRTIVDMLGTSTPDLRRAARECLAAVFSPEVKTQLLHRARSASPAARADAILVLEGHVDDEVAEFLTTVLHDEDPQVRIAALAALANVPVGLADPSVLTDIITYHHQSSSEQALAALCLERIDTLGSNTTIALEITQGPDPVADYCIARALIRHGSWTGVERLIRLLDEHDSTSVEIVGAVARETRQILGRLSGLGAEATMVDYQDWAAFPQKLLRRPLPNSVIPDFFTKLGPRDESQPVRH